MRKSAPRNKHPKMLVTLAQCKVIGDGGNATRRRNESNNVSHTHTPHAHAVHGAYCQFSRTCECVCARACQHTCNNKNGARTRQVDDLFIMGMYILHINKYICTCRRTFLTQAPGMRACVWSSDCRCLRCRRRLGALTPRLHRRAVAIVVVVDLVGKHTRTLSR